jgi:outer membrane protein OmpA-like peptidoglycan-associated protein
MKRDRNSFNVWPTFADIIMGMVFLLLLVAMAFVVDQKDRIINEQIDERKKNLNEAIKETGQGFILPDTNSTSKANEILIRLDSDSLFDSAESALKGGYRDQLTLLARVLEADTSYHEIIVEGHTDDRLFRKSTRGNWGLSADRAISVVKLFQDSTSIDSTLLSPRGYAETQHPDENSLSTVDSALWVRFSEFMDDSSYWGKDPKDGEWWNKLNEEQRSWIILGRTLMRRVDIRVKYNPDSTWSEYRRECEQ